MKKMTQSKENLSRIAEHTQPVHLQIDMKKSIKDIKTKTVEKHRKRQNEEKNNAKDLPDYMRGFDLDDDWNDTSITAPSSQACY